MNNFEELTPDHWARLNLSDWTVIEELFPQAYYELKEWHIDLYGDNLHNHWIDERFWFDFFDAIGIYVGVTRGIESQFELIVRAGVNEEIVYEKNLFPERNDAEEHGFIFATFYLQSRFNQINKGDE